MSEHLPATAEQPFARMLASQNGANVGAIAIEQERAIAEAQGQLTLAKRFPRSMTGAMTEFLETCKSPDFAATAFYSVPNRGSGPSIRFAEEAARCYGNFQYGHRELSRIEGKSEIEVFAWDMQNNNYSKRQITVIHVVDTKNGPRKLIDQNDIDNRIANVASKQMRGRILALLPKHLLAAGQAACKVTLAGGSEKPLGERIVAMVQAFGRFGVNKLHLETHLGHGVDNTTVDELADLMGIFNAIKEGGKASEYFPLGDTTAAEATASTAAAITNQAKQAAKTQRPAAKPVADQQSTASTNNGNAAESAGKTTKETSSESSEKQNKADSANTPAASPPDTAGDEDEVF